MGNFGIFDIVGRIMIGPSSSHTAGAVPIGLTAGQLTGYHLVEVRLQFHGSLAKVYHTPFTDAGVVAGLSKTPTAQKIEEKIYGKKIF